MHSLTRRSFLAAASAGALLLVIGAPSYAWAQRSAASGLSLGPFLSTATPDQQSQYTAIFHQVLLNSISGNLGKFRGVTYTLQGETAQGANTLVGTVINRPNAPSANVQWVVDNSSGSPKVVDVVPEGTSLRLTQRSDYASYLSRHGNGMVVCVPGSQRCQRARTSRCRPR